MKYELNGLIVLWEENNTFKIKITVDSDKVREELLNLMESRLKLKITIETPQTKLDFN